MSRYILTLTLVLFLACSLAAADTHSHDETKGTSSRPVVSSEAEDSILREPATEAPVKDGEALIGAFNEIDQVVRGGGGVTGEMTPATTP